MAAELSFHVEDARFQAALLELARESGKDWSEIILRQARLLAVNLAFVTQPYGDGADVKLAGEAAVRRDLKKVFADAPMTYGILKERSEPLAKAFYKAMLQGNIQEATELVRVSGTKWRNVPLGPFDSALHARSRNNRGRVHRHVPAQILTSGFRKLESYTAKKARLVGFGKAGWATAARDIGGTRGLPQWVTRHKAAPGRAINRSGEALSPHVVLENNVKYISQICPPSQRARALAYQQQKMMASIKIALEKRTRRFNLVAGSSVAS